MLTTYVHLNFGILWQLAFIPQDLTRLKVPVTYLKHMFEDALKQREKSLPRYRYMVSMESSGSAKSSFDQESERRHRDSTGR